MTEMLEAAARAVAIALDAETAARASIGQEPHIRDEHREIALAVMKAMWTPTEEMVRVGEEWRSHCSDIDSLYAQMIGAAIHGS